jgi:hypothetical protein
MRKHLILFGVFQDLFHWRPYLCPHVTLANGTTAKMQFTINSQQGIILDLD